jgi:hypothetical protein
MDFNVTNPTPFSIAKKRILRSKRELKKSLDFMEWARSSQRMIAEFAEAMQVFFWKLWYAAPVRA